MENADDLQRIGFPTVDDQIREHRVKAVTFIREVFTIVAKRRPLGEPLKRRLDGVEYAVRRLNVIGGDIVPNVGSAAKLGF
jgi:hypothetical protein